MSASPHFGVKALFGQQGFICYAIDRFACQVDRDPCSSNPNKAIGARQPIDSRP
ncbi:hypothetical protein [Sphingobium indicum]|uniref:hypothetical protein n=1 Tax=Sphingobium indicum TaxID=332055 RepID=UPI001E556C53|nr:hypothetical protein [Sphingobium indicum]